jgi:malate dehydrogenase (oxaloacetate-decarboxylating)
MCIAAALELARCAEDGGLSEERIVPAMDEWEVYPREAAAVAVKAVEQGLAMIPLTWKEAYEKASAIIKKAREEAAALMEGGFILPPPEC